MMYSMNTTGMSSGFAFFGTLHALAALAIAAGFVLLLAWAIKTFTTKQLIQWGLGLFLGGIVVCLLTTTAVGFGHGSRPFKNSGMMGGQKMMMDGMMDDDDDDRGPGMGGGMGMMSNMGMMLGGLEGDEFDEAFIRMMIPHHEGAIDMAERALESAGHDEMKQLARDIIEAQQREIDMMKGWEREWGYRQ